MTSAKRVARSSQRELLRAPRLNFQKPVVVIAVDLKASIHTAFGYPLSHVCSPSNVY